MAQLGKTFKQVHSKESVKERFLQNPLKKEGLKKGFHNPVNVITKGAEDISTVFTPEIPVPEEQTIIPIPNSRVAENEAKKRRARNTRSSRSSTILTEGLGG